MHGRRWMAAGIALLLVACSQPDEESSSSAPTPTEDSSAASPSAPSSSDSPSPTARITLSVSPTPSGGDSPDPTQATVSVGSKQATISPVLCGEVDGIWVMTAGSQDSVKASARSTSGDEATVDSASILFPDGTLAEIQPGMGNATIERADGGQVIVDGTAMVHNIGRPNPDPREEPFRIEASCAQ